MRTQAWPLKSMQHEHECTRTASSGAGTGPMMRQTVCSPGDFSHASQLHSMSYSDCQTRAQRWNGWRRLDEKCCRAWRQLHNKGCHRTVQPNISARFRTCVGKQLHSKGCLGTMHLLPGNSAHARALLWRPIPCQEATVLVSLQRCPGCLYMC